jgi:small subunit ribosomal protein S29
LNANASSLGSLHTQEELNLDRRTPVAAGTPLTDLINVGVKEPSISPIILTALMEELGKQTKYILQGYVEDLFDQSLLLYDL